MKENNQENNNKAQYIRSSNAGNTLDNAQRHTKEEDPMNASLSNSPIGDKDQESTFGGNGGNEGENKASDA